MKIIRITDL